MRTILFKALITLSLLLSSHFAYAVNCSITSTSMATAYAPTGVVPNVTQGSFDITCSKNAGGLDPNAINYTVAVNNGNNANGTQNRANRNGNQFIEYDTYRNSSCNVAWGSATADQFSGSNVTLPFTITVNYWGCIITAGQSGPAGAYTDTVTMTLSYTTSLGLTATTTNTLSVNITNPASCSIAASIGPVAFGTYTAFRATPLQATNTSLQLNCTPQLPYTMSLDSNSGVVSGLNYSLTINSLTPPVSSRNPGPALLQTHTISGTMPANQAGTCTSGTCTASDPRVLTITY